jgi:histidinol dehydrogenase
MTIETATPSSAEALAALFDTLVDAVAARVLAQLNDNLDARFAMLLESADFEDKVEASVQTAIDSMDLDDAVRQALDNLCLDDMVMSAAQDLTYEVRVSR